jgi:predicted component of type VI protein secretion system
MRYLFERLCDPARQQDARGEPDARQAVRDQVQRLAWTCPGEAADGEANVVPFGMPSIVEPGPASAPGLERYAREFRRLLERHEPRLRDPSVTLEPTGRSLEPYRLLVTGVLDDGGALETLSFAVDLAGG